MVIREVVALSYGGPASLAVREIEAPRPGRDEVLVEVRAIGVNAWDVKSYSGSVGSDPARLPIRLGAECSGVVLESRSEDIAEGEEVIVHPVSAAYADHVVAPAASILRKPASLSWEQAAGLMLTGTAAAHLVDATAPGEGETVLLHGAAGGVGLFAAQLAARRGARVLGTALPQDHPLLIELGIEPCDFREDVVGWVLERVPEGVDAVLDTVGTAAVLDISLAVTRTPGRTATLVPSRAATERGVVQLGFGDGAEPGTIFRHAARHDLVRAVTDGWLLVVVAASYPLADAARAHEAIVGDHRAGKITLTT